MPKFQALQDMISLVIPYIERDELGNVIRDQSISFNKGTRIGKDKVIPANISTEEPNLVKYLKAYPGNEANGGKSFREIVEKKSEVKAEVSATKEIAPEPPVNDGSEETASKDVEGESTGGTQYSEVTTVQAAGTILKGLFSDLTSRDVNNKEKVLAVAASKNISFPNL